VNKNITRGFVIGAPMSGSGKTIVTLSLLRFYKKEGLRIKGVKIGPDYIDPSYHARATGKPCNNLDFWAMRDNTIKNLINESRQKSDLIIFEGVMGLFDGALTAQGISIGSTADAAKALNLPIVLVVDAKGQGSSISAIIQGFKEFRDDIGLAGVIFNRVSSKNHERILRQSLSQIDVVCLGCIPNDERLALDHRHLGLIQASEITEIDDWLDNAARIVSKNIDIKLLELKTGMLPDLDKSEPVTPLKAFGEHIAIARDNAFNFSYGHIINGWKKDGVKISFFSPLADEALPMGVDSVYLPGGYPELFAEALSANLNFMTSLRSAAKDGASIYGECGGFMILGEELIDRNGFSHSMAGLLPVKTSFEHPKLNLGYRLLTLVEDGFLGTSGDMFKAHEFHYSTLVNDNRSSPLFKNSNARGENLNNIGCKVANVAGSFAHIIDSV
tara:strand:- start:303 stop:1634 length:1332 start_codon:yes stop_codon:yes gene_type:complete